MNPASTVAEWLTWAAAVPRLGYTPLDLGASSGPEEEWLSGRESDWAASNDEAATERSFWKGAA